MSAALAGQHAVVTGGSPMNLSEVHDLADAVLLVWYPGEEGGNAVGDIIFGNVSPSGKLPITFPKSLDDLPKYEDYNMKGRTYRYMKKEPMYPFGFGLSYTRFTYSNLKLSKAVIGKTETVQASVTVTNSGKVESDEVVQLYLAHVNGFENSPIQAIKGFKRISLKPGAFVNVKFALTPDMLSLVNDRGESVTDTGKIRIIAEGSQPGARSQALGAAKTVETMLTIQ
jgi:beta-glucosidase